MTQGSRAATWAAPLLVALAALVAYANSLRNGFVWDDPIILTRQLVVFRSVGDVLAPPRDIPQFSPDYYRPLTIATYLLDRAVGGGDAFPFHLSVVLAHTAASVLVYALALQLLAVGRRGRQTASAPRADSSDAVARVGAVSAGALFALHPIHTESVAWAAGRSDVLATGFLLAVLVVTGQPQRTWVTSVLGAAFALAALGTKETAVAIYPLMFLRDVLVPPMPRPTRGDWLRGWVGPLLAGLVYVLLRRNALGEFVGSAPDALAAGQRSLGDLIGAIGMYLGRLVWPVPLNAYIDHIDTGPMTVGLALVFVAGFATAFWLWNRAKVQGIDGSRVQASPGKKAPTTRGSSKQAPTRNLESSNPRTLNVGILLFGLAWLGLTLAPSLAIVWKIPDAPIAERYLYLPSVGFCLLIGYAAARAWAAASTQSTRWAVAGAVALLLLASAIVTVRRNPVWHDDIALWEDTEQNSQVSGMAARSAGTAYQQAGRPADARAAFERALQRRNTQRGLQTIYNNLGTLAMFDRDYAAAQRYYEAAMAANPSADTVFNLGLAVLYAGGRTREAAQAALPHYQRAQSLNPHDPDVEAAQAEAYDILGQRDAAVQHAQRALDLGAQGQTADSLRAMLQR